MEINRTLLKDISRETYTTESKLIMDTNSSRYIRINNQGKLMYYLDPERSPSVHERFVYRQFKDFILSNEFGCAGAKTSLSNNNCGFGLYEDMRSDSQIHILWSDLCLFIKEREFMSSPFTTYVAAFIEPRHSCEKDFENNLWYVLQRIRDIDKQHFAVDPNYPSNPEEDKFALSIGTKGFFVVGMDSSASRIARRFSYPTLVFNLTEQFDKLRQEKKFSKLQKAIRKKEYNLQGNINPNLDKPSVHQFSGRETESTWKCPFHN